MRQGLSSLLALRIFPASISLRAKTRNLLSERKLTKKPAHTYVDRWLGYKGTNITGEKAVKDAKKQLIDALMAFEHHLDLFQGAIDGLRQKLQCLQVFKGLDLSC